MPHLESLEPRQLYATGIDTGFAAGGLSVRNTPLKQLLPTAAGLFVETANAKSVGGSTVAKYTAAGTLDTTWGDRGRIAVGPGFDTAISLAYDPRSGALYVASPTAPGDTSGHVLDVQRYNADGTLDTTFGNRGTFLAAPAAVHKRQYDLARMTPLAGGKLLIAYAQSERGTEPNGVDATNEIESELRLLRLNRAGRSDSTFGSRGGITLATGSTTYEDYIGSGSFHADTQTLADLRVRADGSLRVLTLQDRVVQDVMSDFDDETVTLDDVQRLTSVVVNTNGGVRKAATRAWTVSRSSDTTSGDEDPINLFTTQSTHLDPDGNVTVIGRRGDFGRTIVLSLSNTGDRAAPRALTLPADTVADAVVYADDGTAFAATASKIIAYDATLTPVPSWGTAGVLASPNPNDVLLAADTQGRLFVLDDDRKQIRRLDGD